MWRSVFAIALILMLVVGAGAPFVARWTMGYPYETIETIKRGIQKKGFSFIEILTPCPTGYSPESGLKGNRQIWDWFKQHTLLASKYRQLSDEERAAEDRMLIGVLQDVDRREFTEEWAKLVEQFGACDDG